MNATKIIKGFKQNYWEIKIARWKKDLINTF